ncbi:hypothetical protein IWX83_000075 [Flavobacterium sp. CG_9.1]|uniref:Uncharacterized protein n=1 Tax=Flavobacterium fryxellicola TaxID=249352 RepID=A0A167XBJ8_9FLAO|nr:MULTISPECIES: hypothetical protein [Flavobacterium]MBG6060312.1 hypothetical protein [Flavobacterium sp. CG_9.1]OAB28194.1 hypothetical protein FBFR_10155 [Flavobacterium fryxellicola]SHN78040.1 hypothetical protein SAMN05444395_11245 [Flavobacterium fryxellicola]
MFTALAVVAFNGVAMAKTEEVKTNSLNVEKVAEKTCEEKAVDIYEGVMGSGSDNLALLNDLIGLCH